MSFNENALRIGAHPLSFSKLEVAKTCGYLYTKKYIERVKPVDQTSLVAANIGTAIHTVLELSLGAFALCTEMPDALAIREMVDRTFNALISGETLTTDELGGVKLLLANTETLLARLLNFIIKHKCKVYLEAELAIDREFRPVKFDSGQAFFRGKLDLVIVLPSGFVWVIDHKTSRVNEYQTRYDILAKHADQLKAYDVLVYHGMRDLIKKEHGINIKAILSGLAYVVLADIIESPTPTKLADLQVETTQWFIDWVNKLSDRAIEGKVNRAKHCEWCGYKTLCGSKRGLKKKSKAVAL